MYEPITVVKVRKATTVKVPAGGWLMLFGPETPLHQQIAARAKLVKDGNINEDYSLLLIGRLQDTNSPAQFVTAEQAEAVEADRKAREESFRKSNEQAAELENKKAEESAAEAKAEHEERVKKLNTQNDAIRNQKISSPAPKPQIETQTEKE